MSTPTKTLIVAGATGYGVWPANTLEGARACLAEPIDGIEIDVLLTADGHVVAHHDYWLNKDATRLDGEWLAERGPALKALTLDELRRYDIGRSKPGSEEALRHPDLVAFDGASTPTLPELLDLLKAAPGPRRLIYIEIKTDPQDDRGAPDAAAITRAVLDDVEAAGYGAHTKIIAFDWQVLRFVKARHPDMATAHLTIPVQLADGVKRLPDGRSPWLDGADAPGLSELEQIKAHGGMEWSPYFTDVTPERMAEAEALGLKVGPWGLGKAKHVDRMIDLGVFSATVSGPYWGSKG